MAAACLNALNNRYQDMDSTSLESGAWVAVQVQSGFEKIVAEGLRQRGYEEFLPLRRSREFRGAKEGVTSRPLFPGYLFCRYIRCPSYRIVDIPSVIRMVSFSKIPARIPDHEIEAIRRVVQSGFCTEPCSFVQVGQPVVVRRGALEGTRGRLISVRNRLRLVIGVELLGRAVAVEIDSSALAFDVNGSRNGVTSVA